MSWEKFLGIEKVFCKSCGQKLTKDQSGRLVGMEFQDGWYCEYCGKNKKKQK